MNFGFTEEQELLRTEVRKFLDEKCPLDEVRKLVGGDSHQPVVLYCKSGRRAGLVKTELEAAGFDRVTNLGGFSDWPG